jgi:hypothetical protein
MIELGAELGILARPPEVLYTLPNRVMNGRSAALLELVVGRDVLVHFGKGHGNPSLQLLFS